MDTRSERELRMRGDAGLNARLTGSTQWAALMSWLLKAQKERPDHPKFVISGTPVAPVCRSFVEQPSLWRREDGWAGYPSSLSELVHFIVKQQIRNVVFVGGDLHLSAFGSLTFTLDGYDPVTAWQIVSSGLYAPMPFANSHIADYAWNEPYTVPLATGSARIEAEVGLLYAGESHFVRVDTKRVGSEWQLEVSAFDASGNAVEPLQPPPRGAVQSDRRWSVTLSARTSEEPPREQTEPAPI
jgi:cholesterol oxidase